MAVSDSQMGISGAHVIYRIERGKALEMSRPETPKVSAGATP